MRGGDLDPRLVRDVLTGLAPASGATCPRCHGETRALANGRGRLDICAQCGTLDLRSSDGLELLRLHAGTTAAEVRRGLASLRLR